MVSATLCKSDHRPAGSATPLFLGRIVSMANYT